MTLQSRFYFLKSHKFNLNTKCSCSALENYSFTYSAVGGTSQLDTIAMVQDPQN